ncbi:MAG: hypothetical protein O3A00_09985 [Planctomycetota bacterium]|nr:hypothetical protein [Planctomycetota bacterium]
MRLTLRTLLAYLDDILEPAQAKEIGQKIAESAYASELVKRTKEVMRRRRLTAPDVDGPGAGVDANTIGEYLDNTLPPESVADIEKICLDSDVHLAEVAACHQILTLVLGEPIEIQPNSRERMYALGPVPEGSRVAAGSSLFKKVKHPVVSNQNTARQRTKPRGTDPNEFTNSLPDYLKPNPFWKRTLPLILITLVVGVWVGLIVADPTFFPADGQAVNPENPESKTAAPESKTTTPETAKVDAKSQPVIVAVNEGPPKQIEPKVDPGPGASTPDPTGIDPVPPPDANAKSPEPKTVTPSVEPTSPTTLPLGPETKVPPIAPIAPVTTVNLQANPLSYKSTTGVVVRQDANGQRWSMLARRSLVFVNEPIVVPEPFDGEFGRTEAAVRMRILSGSRFHSVGLDAMSQLGIHLDQGRVLLSAVEPASGEYSPAVVKCVIGQDEWYIELSSKDSVCGIQVLPRLPEQIGEAFGADSYAGRVLVQAGSVRVTMVNMQPVEILANQQFVLRLPHMAAVAVRLTEPPLMPLWLTPGAGTETSTQRRYAALFEKEFDPAESVEFSIAPLIDDARPRIAEMAVKCLALTENIPALVQALASEHEESRAAAIQGLSSWLPRNEQHSQQLTAAMQLRYRREEAEIIHRLLWGFSTNDLQKQVMSTQLVDWLENSEVAIRELAFYHINQLTGRDMGYRPLSPAVQRSPSVGRWRDHIDSNGALIPADAPATTTNRYF